MDEKTEQLRDIFLSVSDEDTVTERQEQGHGSLAQGGDVREGLASVVEEMQTSLDFETALSIHQLVTVVDRYYQGATDEEIASELSDEVSPREVFEARLDLHIVRDSDQEAPFDLDRLRELRGEDVSTAEMAEQLDASQSDVRRLLGVIDTQEERRRVADRYREAFEDVLQDRELAERLTSSLQETGLEEATEGQEVDVDF